MGAHRLPRTAARAQRYPDSGVLQRNATIRRVPALGRGPTQHNLPGVGIKTIPNRRSMPVRLISSPAGKAEKLRHVHNVMIHLAGRNCEQETAMFPRPYPPVAKGLGAKTALPHPARESRNPCSHLPSALPGRCWPVIKTPRRTSGQPTARAPAVAGKARQTRRQGPDAEMSRRHRRTRAVKSNGAHGQRGDLMVPVAERRSGNSHRG